MYRLFHLILSLSLVLGATAQTNIFTQDFEAFADGTETSSAWSASSPNNTDYFAVYSNGGNHQWWGDDTDGAATWLSASIDVSQYSNLSFAIFLGESGNLEGADYIRVSYVLDGSTVQLVEFTNDFGTSSQSGLTIPNGSSLQIQVVMDNDANDESHFFDDLVLTGLCTGESDAIGVCGGTCASDADSDGICDDSEDQCTDTSAANYDDPANGDCQFQIFYEPFTDDSQFTKNAAFSHDGSDDYWGIYDPAGNGSDFDGNSGQPSGIGSFTGVDGNFLVGEDMNAAPVVADPGILTWSNIDISTYEAALTFELDIAERGATSDEFVELYAKLSGDGSWTLLMDPGGDLGSIGSTLTKQTASGNFDGTSLDIQLRMYSDDGGDEVAVDDLRVLGTSSCTAVTVSADAPTVSLDGNGAVSVSAGDSGAEVSATSTGDCFTVTGYEVSKTSSSAGFASSVSFDCSETGAQDLWVRATDGSSTGAATATTVTVQDVTAPTIGALSGTYYLGEGGGSTASTRRIWWATATDGNGDNCGVDIKKVSKTGNDWESATNFVDFDCSELGPQTIYLQGTDAAGNVAEGSGTITIADNTPPTIAAPATVNANTSPYGGACSVTASFLSLGTPTATDNCSVSEVTNDAPSSFPVGTTVVTWTATDASGNAATATQDVVITDDQIPSTPSLADANFQLSLGAVSVGLTDLTVSATDNCTDSGNMTYEISRTAVAGTWGTSVDFDCNDADGKFYPVYVRASDASGNTSPVGVGYITISDAATLEAIGQDVTLVLGDGGSATLTAAEVDNGSQGNCNSTLSISQGAFGCEDVGTNPVDLTVTDGSNSDVTTVTVTVVDNCSCDGNSVDALGVCGGDCLADADNDGICDDVDDCVGTLDGCGVCNGSGVTWSLATGDLSGGSFEEFTFEATSLAIETLGVTMAATGGDADNWASDLLISVTDPSGNSAEWGGYDATYGYTSYGEWPASWDSEAEAGSPWSADIDLSAANLSGSGTWTVRVADGWMNSPNSIAYDLDFLICGANNGCTDSNACNYDPNAIDDDGSCIDPHPELGCCSFEGTLDAVLSGGESSNAFTFEATGTPVSLGLILDWTDLLPSTDAPDASDLLVTITDPNGLCVSFGGQDLTADGCTSLGNGNDWPSDWNSNSASYQQYADTLNLAGSGLQGNGEWSLEIANGRSESGPVSYGLQWGFEGLCFLSDEAEGCTDEGACNYDSAATVDDGSCLMPDPLSGCVCEQTGSQVLSALPTDTVGSPETFLGSSFPGPTLLEIDLDFTNVESNPNSWPSDMVVRILAPDASCLWFGGWDANTPPPGCSESDELNIYWPASWNTPNPGPLTAAMDLTGADLLTGTGEWSITVLNGWSGTTTGGMTDNPVIYDLEWTLTGVCEIPGCTDSDAVNFLDTATEDDGSCLFGGCLDELACNYDATADVADDSCLFLDDCGVCGGAGIPEGDCDCDGNQPDAIDVCGGDCAADVDADGICDDVDPCVGSLDACGICNGPGEVYECGCADIPTGDCDCNGNQLDALDECGGDCAADADEDGICDDVDPCVGSLDACGVCNGPGEVYECGCADIPTGDCDCNGNQLDALDECGGDCAADVDEDGICDNVDPCVGALDACGVCNGPGEVYECGCADIPTEDCDCDGNQLDALNECGGDCAADIDEDGICDVDEIPGCTSESACNFNPSATDDDGSCKALDACGICDGPGDIYECGCTDIPEGDCDCDGNQLDALEECGGSCAADADEDGICDDVDPCVGSLDACGICNGPGEVYECGCADIPEGDCDCNGNQLDALDECGGSCAADADEDGICDDVDPCVGALDACGVCNGPGEVYECGCTDIPTGDCDCDGNQLDALDDCGGDCAADADEDGICDDVDPCVGSLDACGVCNGPGEVYECGCADIPEGDCDCDGNQLDALDECGGDCAADADEDGICDDVDPCVGSLDACGICNGPGEVYECGCADIPEGDCDCNGNQLDALEECGGDCAADTDEDGICDDVDPCVGALDACGVCNGPGEVYECGCADIPTGDCDCDGNQLDALDECGGDCAADADEDGICDDVDPCVGFLDACGICNGPGEVYECGCADIPEGDCDCDGNQLDALEECGGDCAADADEDGICDDVDPCVGSLDACGICNGPGEVYECGCADIPEGDCDCDGNQLDALDECGGDCAADADEDGICDDVDPCVGALDACGVCNGPGEVYECGCSDIPEGECDCDGNQLDALEECGGDCAADADEDGICDDVDPCVGSLDACGICNGPGEVYECGCADIPEGDCDCNGNQLDALDECGGDCAADADEDGICDNVDPCVGSLDACGICNGPGEVYECGCADIPTGDCDCDGNQLDALDECGGSCAADADEDGICDDVDPCVGALDACGVCNGPGEVYECGCTDIPTGDCDCDGNQLDALDECGGSCAADADEDGICDDVDPCVGSLDACGVCNGPGEVYECGCADIPEGDCDCDGNQLDALDECGGDCAADADEDGICDDVDPCVGALDACGICNGPGEVYECGCADIPTGDCDCDGNQLDALDECGGDCAADADEDGICDDVDPCVGSLDACGICNGPGEVYECGCADIPTGDCDCNGNQLDALDECGGDCAADADEDGICDDVDPCVGSLDACGICNGPGEVYECGCADIPTGDCDCDGNQLDALDECGGDCAADTDEDGICDDVDPCIGSLDACGVCNGPGEVYECGCADIPHGDCDCDGNQLDALEECGGDCVADSDEDGICDDVDPCVGSLDACGICNGPGEVYECGCADIPEGDCDCDGNQLDALDECGGDCAADADEDGICDDVDPCVGALDACGICNGPGEVYECGCSDIPTGDCDCDGNQLDALEECGGDCAADADEDGICDDVDPCVGALDACGVCNGPGEVYECGCADIPTGDCDCDGNQLDALEECGGDCVADADEDGICDDVDPCVGFLDACGICNGPGAVYECGCADIPTGDCDCDGNQLDALDECGGDCAADADEDGICDDVDPCVGSLDACGICNGPGEVYECGCADIPTGDCDCDGNQLDALDECGGDCAADADEDGICDDVDPCVGSLDACGICNGPGEVYECGCADIPTEDCDCDGNQLDALDECGGSCAADADEDGICDDVDPCVGALDACGICNGPGEVYECGCADIPTGDCDCDGNQLDALDECGGDCTADADEDGICDDVDSCIGALDACGICNGPGEVYECGCDDIPAGDCDCDGNQLDAIYECGGDCTADIDDDGICDVDEIPGCTSESACNYNPEATDDDGSCQSSYYCGPCYGSTETFDCGCWAIPVGDCDCDGNQLDALDVCGGDCAADADNDGICDDEDPCVGALDICGVCNGLGAVYDCGCEDFPAGDCDCNGNQPDALGECGGDCAADTDQDGICDDEDPCIGALDACGVCNGPGEVYECGCADIPTGDCDCNGNQTDALGECGGDCAADADQDGICDDVDPCVGTLDACGICNGPGEVYECGCSDIPDGDCDCDGNQLDAIGICGGDCQQDENCDGICDPEVVEGCTYPGACNYNPSAVQDDGSCAFPLPNLNCDGTCLLDSDEDGICDGDEIPGCTDDTAVNFHPAATENDGTCVYGFVSSCLGDIDNNGVVGVGDVLLLLNFYSSVCE